MILSACSDGSAAVTQGLERISERRAVGTLIKAHSGAIDAVPISDDDIARKLTNLASAPLGLDSDDDFRISLAGVQEKTALLQIDGNWFIA